MARRRENTITAAARRIGITASALSTWMKRRGLTDPEEAARRHGVGPAKRPGPVPRRHIGQGGRMLTARQAAEELGVARGTVDRRLRAGEPLSIIMEEARPGPFRGHRHCVHGTWMTVREAAERCGTTPNALYVYRCMHKCLLEEAYDHYMAIRRGEIAPRFGPEPKRQRIRGVGMLTVREAAERLGIREQALRKCMHDRGCGLQGAWVHYEARAKEQAVERMVEIIFRE